MADENRTRIEEILSGVRDDVARRRAAGGYGVGYEAGIEIGHDKELGKVERPTREDLTPLLELLATLGDEIGKLSEIERDSSRFGPLRYLRELAMTRHQMIRLNRDMRGIAEAIEHLARVIVENEEARTIAHEKIAQELFDKVIERTAILERITAAFAGMEAKIEQLEKRDRP